MKQVTVCQEGRGHTHSATFRKCVCGALYGAGESPEVTSGFIVGRFEHLEGNPGGDSGILIS